MTSPTRTYTMEDLTRVTGFTARQIRYYITRKLVPGAGERGPYVTYGQDTLDRLKLVKRLKAVEVQPTGRPLTLNEIRASIDSLGNEGAAQLVDGGTELAIIDTETGFIANATHEIRGSHWMHKMVMKSDAIMLQDSVSRTIFSPSPDLGELGPLLRNLESTLSDMLHDPEPQNARLSADAEQWRRIRIPDIEIQVRVPDDASRRRRLERIRTILNQLLEQGR